MRRLPALLMVALIAAMSVLVPARPVTAATYRNFVAQVPADPSPASTVRIWMNSDTCSAYLRHPPL
jgi:hypothetical protein